MKDRISTMVDRFLGWKLPKTFGPDCGISFKPSNGMTREEAYDKVGWWPIGTNLFTATEAREMLEHVLAGDPVRAALAELVACKALKDAAEAIHFAGPLSQHGENWKVEYDRMRADYLRRQPLAWEAARAALGVNACGDAQSKGGA